MKLLKKTFLLVILFAQSVLADTGYVIKRDADQIPHIMKIERTSGESLSILYCGPKSKFPETDGKNCEMVLSDVTGVRQSNLPEEINDRLIRFRDSKETTIKKWKAGAQLLAWGSVAGGCIAFLGGCIWAPILFATEGSGGLALLILAVDVAGIYSFYQWQVTTGELTAIDKGYRDLFKGVTELILSKNNVANVTVPQVFAQHFINNVRQISGR